MKIKTAMFILIAGCAVTAVATWQYIEAQEPTTRAECYLKNTRNVQTDIAARMVRSACDRQFPEPVNIFDQFDN